MDVWNTIYNMGKFTSSRHFECVCVSQHDGRIDLDKN